MTLVSPTLTKWLEEARQDPEAFWARAARTLPWFRTWDRVFERDGHSFRWFVGAETNLAHNAVDRQVDAGEGGRAAVIYLNVRVDAAQDPERQDHAPGAARRHPRP